MQKVCFEYSQHICVLGFIGPNSLLTYLLLLFTVLYGDVHSVHPVRPALVYLVCVLLEGSAEDPVLDSRGDFPGDGGDGRLLCRI